MSDGDDEEAVASIGDTCEGIVPGSESSQETEETTGLLDVGVGVAVRTTLQVGNTEQEEGQVQGEEQQEEGDGGLEGAEQHDGGEDEPALLRHCQRGDLLRIDYLVEKRNRGHKKTHHQEKTHGVIELGRIIAGLAESLTNLEPTGGQDDSEREPETTVGGESSSTESVTDSHFPKKKNGD